MPRNSSPARARASRTAPSSPSAMSSNRSSVSRAPTRRAFPRMRVHFEQGRGGRQAAGAGRSRPLVPLDAGRAASGRCRLRRCRRGARRGGAGRRHCVIVAHRDGMAGLVELWPPVDARGGKRGIGLGAVRPTAAACARRRHVSRAPSPIASRAGSTIGKCSLRAAAPCTAGDITGPGAPAQRLRAGAGARAQGIGRAGRGRRPHASDRAACGRGLGGARQFPAAAGGRSDIGDAC